MLHVECLLDSLAKLAFQFGTLYQFACMLFQHTMFVKLRGFIAARDGNEQKCAKWRNIKPSKADIADSEYFMLLNYLTDELKETKAIQLTSAVIVWWWMHRFIFFSVLKLVHKPNWQRLISIAQIIF